MPTFRSATCKRDRCPVHTPCAEPPTIGAAVPSAREEIGLYGLAADGKTERVAERDDREGDQGRKQRDERAEGVEEPVGVLRDEVFLETIFTASASGVQSAAEAQRDLAVGHCEKAETPAKKKSRARHGHVPDERPSAPTLDASVTESRR